MRRKRRKRKVVKSILVVLIAIGAAIPVHLMRTDVTDNLEEIGRMRANVMVSQIVNKALNEQFYKDAGAQNLLIRKNSADGNLEVLEANTQAINLLVTEIGNEIRKEFASRPQDEYSMPLGALLGSKVFSDMGPRVELKIIPSSVTGTDFRTEFESQGINQTKYKIYIEITCRVKVLVPLASDTFDVTNTVLLAEAVILGNVPESYVNVPEEDILDVTQE